MNAPHCWHVDSKDGVSWVRGDGARAYVCCACGERAYGTSTMEHRRPPGHGPHAPAELVRVLGLPPVATACPTPVVQPLATGTWPPPA